MKLKDYTQGIISALRGGNPTPSMVTRDDLGWTKVAGSTVEGFKSNDFENAYPSITKITNRFMKVRPFAIDATGERVEETPPVINALYHPNKLNSSVEFREALALMYLVHPKTHILVWRKQGGKVVPGGKITPQNIAGFTFMENITTVTVAGKTTYTITNGNTSNTYTDDEVITLRGLNPYAINTGGFSATQAACKWTTLDDYIAQYQQGFFRNGAVPSGEFVITAKTVTEFKDIVDKMQAKHRGVDNNNNILYTHRPTDHTGKPVDAQIEWIPYASSNKELALNDLFEQANKKIDSAYGVPASIRGVGENNNYATARTDQQNFVENVVDPITLKIWTAFTHELNRITGGLGVAISYELEIPALVDEEKVVEETGKIRDERVQLWLNQGYSIESIKTYLDTGDITELDMNNTPDDDGDDPDVDDGTEVRTSPDANRTQRLPKAQSPDPNVDTQLVPFETEIETLLNAQIDRDLQRTISNLTVNALTEEQAEEDEAMGEELAAILLLLLMARGDTRYNSGMTEAMAAGLDISDASKFTGSLSDVDKQYVLDIAKGFNEDTREALSKLIEQYRAEGLSNDEIVSRLRANFKPSQDYRVQRFAGNEAWRVSEVAAVLAMTQLEDQLNKRQKAETYKTWLVQPGACPECLPYANNRVLLRDTFMAGVEKPPLHVSCRCLLQFTILKVDELEMRCNACDRFLGVTNTKDLKAKIKCSNSKCKNLDIPKVKEAE